MTKNKLSTLPRRKVISEFKEAVDYAAQVRIRYVVTESGGVPGKLEDWGYNPPHRSWELTLDSPGATLVPPGG